MRAFAAAQFQAPRHEILRALWRFLMSRGIWLSTPTLQDGFISSKYKTLNPGQPVASGCRDALMTNPGFDVPFTTTVDVSGGGTALATAVAAAGANTRLRITDSLTYSEVTITSKTNLTIEAAAGQTPTISRAAPGVFPSTSPGWEIRINGTCAGLKFKGLAFLDHGNRNSLSFADNGCINAREDCLGLTDVIIEDCTFTEAADSPLNGKQGVNLMCGGAGTATYDRVVIRRCTFTTMGAGANTTGDNMGMITVAGFDRVWIQNCWLKRDNALVVRTSSNSRGVVVRNANTIIEDVLVDDIGTAGSDEAFNHIASSGAQFGSATGPTTIRNCVAFNAKRGYRMQLTGTTLTMTFCVYDTDVVGILAGNLAVRRDAGAIVCQDSVLTGAGDGTTFSAAGITEDHNDVFNFGAMGKVLDPTDLTVDPAFEDAANRLWPATNAAVLVGANDGGPQGVRYTPTGELVFWCG